MGVEAVDSINIPDLSHSNEDRLRPRCLLEVLGDGIDGAQVNASDGTGRAIDGLIKRIGPMPFVSEQQDFQERPFKRSGVLTI